MKGASNPPVRRLSDLVERQLIRPEEAEGLAPVAERYPVAIPAYLAQHIAHPDNEALRRQFLPSRHELKTTPLERADPIADHAFSPLTGLVHRYPDRVLVKLVHVCPVYCRFCFRREMVGPEGDGTLSKADFAAILDYIAARPAIWEVILTGGDPFMLSARRIAEITRALAAIPHVRILRWHTRLPVADPQRVTASLTRALKSPDAATYVAIHANHAAELTAKARAALKRLSEAGIGLVSQSVLLKGVNDSVEGLEALMRAFVEAGVKPYYLHHPDLAPGTAHFRLPVATGQKLMRALRQRLSGLAVPIYVLDVPDGAGKVPLGPSYVDETADGLMIKTRGGGTLLYPPRPSP